MKGSVADSERLHADAGAEHERSARGHHPTAIGILLHSLGADCCCYRRSVQLKGYLLT
jgi:hypothetical protein